ncbi:hypothetical protein TBLA_0C07280 [Henningerozyma blattae CBS 6284]|uniref:Uncharacterized protein n=1 Tax=Henningerozyma blattae (strain ATCC 34711 / CBS 6284 / DSM 70876 / NBRC 10599 / NRRL Y-10934 / UCD 77-7) TaxID=1071380 RepID=I2H2B7_HENB6|nr:hypothetical protein TBLA_0C07280 [Tetrapisispora blattae CBS 6284]CCH60519.1 hypothetical protein TBLA_0C07280 [Tetrapisispora blattae CBS 6284]
MASNHFINDKSKEDLVFDESSIDDSLIENNTINDNISIFEVKKIFLRILIKPIELIFNFYKFFIIKFKNNKLKFISISIFLTLLNFILGFAFSSNDGKNLNFNNMNIYNLNFKNLKSINDKNTNFYIYNTYISNWLKGNNVYSKRDLLNVDINPFLKFKDFKNSPISNKIRKEQYLKMDVNGYVSNIKLPAPIDSKNQNHHGIKQNSIIDENENINNKNDYGRLDTLFYNNFFLNGKYSTSLASILNDSKLIDCDTLRYENEISYSKERILIQDSLFDIREQVLGRDDPLSKWTFHDNEKDKSVDEVVRTHWGKFGSATIWLETEQCYITVTRVMYSSRGLKSAPDVSMIRAQAFDKYWHEIKGKKIRKIDVELPDDIEIQLANIDKEFDQLISCESLFENDSNQYKSCIAKNKEITDNINDRKNKITDSYYITYPTVYQFPFNPRGYLRGPEDPRIILRKNGDKQEPVVVFNMDNGDGRRMYGFLPHRAFDNFVHFYLREDKNSVQKNWTPFFTEEDIETVSDVSPGTIHFIRRFAPFEVVQCSLLDGVCDMVYKSEFLNDPAGHNFGIVRGGTQMVPLPDIIPKIFGKQMWIGFTKLHLDKCGCGERFYRPMLTLLVEKDGVYNQDLIVPSMDFQTDVLSWDRVSTECKEYNVMSPNSIAAWDVVGQDPKTRKFDDFLIFSYSEADAVSKVITVRGILDYILNIYSQKDIEEDFIQSDDTDFIFMNSFECLHEEAKNICKAYGEKHKQYLGK